MAARRGLVGLLVVAAACSPFAAAPGDTDGGDAKASAPPLPDGGGSDDGALTLDASKRPCAHPAAHDVCEDFDRPMPWSEWARVEETGSLIDADPQLFVSPPSSMRVVVAAGTSPNHPSYLYRSVAFSKHVHVEAELFITLTTNVNGEIDFLALELEPPVGFDRYLVALVAKSDGKVLLEADANGSRQQQIDAIPVGWTHVSLDLDLVSGTLTGTVGRARQTLDVPKAVLGKGADLRIGAAWASNNTGSYSVNIDDVVLDADR